jgi:hypothetical protein
VSKNTFTNTVQYSKNVLFQHDRTFLTEVYKLHTENTSVLWNISLRQLLKAEAEPYPLTFGPLALERAFQSLLYFTRNSREEFLCKIGTRCNRIGQGKALMLRVFRPSCASERNKAHIEQAICVRELLKLRK